MQDKDQTKDKLVYEKPQLRRIDLAAEEVLDVGCKAQAIWPVQAGQGCLSGVCKFLGT